jgi:CheY-like chemotaxis protein
MLPDMLNFLQNLLLPMLLGVIVVGAVVVFLVGRQPRPRPRQQAAARPQAGAAARTSATAPARPVSPVPVAAAAQGPAVPQTAADTAPSPDQAQAPAPAPALPLLADLLLVDDSAVVRAKLRRLFEPAGYSHKLAHDGAEALALLAQGRYAVMVTDLEMPRLDGVGLIRATQALPACAGMPILAITGHDDLQAQLSQLQAVAGIYRKPWIDDDLLGHVQALVQPSLRPELAVDEG